MVGICLISVDEALLSKEKRSSLGWCKNCPFDLCKFNEKGFGGQNASCRSQSGGRREEVR